MDLRDGVQHALGWALGIGNARTLAMLLDAGADVNVEDGYCSTALIAASRDGHTDVVDVLLKHKADVNARGDNDKTALMLASEKGHTDVVSRLLQAPQLRSDAVDSEYGRNALMQACDKGHADVVKLLLEKKETDINAVDKKDGMTALMYASIGKHADVVELLLQKLPNVAVQDRHGRTALHFGHQSSKVVFQLLKGTPAPPSFPPAPPTSASIQEAAAIHNAAVRGDVETIKSLLDGGANVNAVNSGGLTPLMQASRYGHVDAVKLLLENTETDIDAVDRDGETALIHASMGKHADVVELLLQNKQTDVNARGSYGRTALMHASMRDSIEVVTLLLNSGRADLFAVDINGRTALFLDSSDSRVAEPLMKAWWKAAEDGDVGTLSKLLDNGADVNAVNDFGSTALMVASDRNQVEVVKLLLKKKETNISARDQTNKTALIRACLLGYTEVVSLLLKNTDTDVNAADQEDRTLLMHASIKGHAEVVHLLLERNANVVAEDVQGNTAFDMAHARDHNNVILQLQKAGKSITSATIHEASASGNVDTLQMLLAYGTPVDALDASGSTALISASKKGHANVVEFLLKRRANVNLKDTVDDWSALIWASARGHAEVVHLLLLRKADVNGSDNRGLTALMAASEFGRKSVVSRLLREPRIRVNAVDKSGWNALVWASAGVDVIKMLLAKQAHSDYATPTTLTWASNGNAEVPGWCFPC